MTGMGQSSELHWGFPNGTERRETLALADGGDGTLYFRLSAARLRESGAAALRVTPSFGHAEKGDAGYWFSPYGYYGEWNRDNGFFRPGADRMNMPMFGWATQRGAWLAVIVSLRLYPRMVVEAEGGRYAVSCELDGELCREPYEDFEIVFHPFPAGTGYAALARRYRELQIAHGAIRPLRERMADLSCKRVKRCGLFESRPPEIAEAANPFQRDLKGLERYVRQRVQDGLRIRHFPEKGQRQMQVLLRREAAADTAVIELVLRMNERVLHFIR